MIKFRNIARHGWEITGGFRGMNESDQNLMHSSQGDSTWLALVILIILLFVVLCILNVLFVVLFSDDDSERWPLEHKRGLRKGK